MAKRSRARIYIAMFALFDVHLVFFQCSVVWFMVPSGRALAASALISVVGWRLWEGRRGGGCRGQCCCDGCCSRKPKTVAINSAADCIGSEWSEDVLKVGLSESDIEQWRDAQVEDL